MQHWAISLLSLVDELRAALSGNVAEPWATWQQETEVLGAGTSVQERVPSTELAWPWPSHRPSCCVQIEVR